MTTLISILAYSLAAAHILLLPSALRNRSSQSRKTATALLLGAAVAYIALAVFHLQFVPSFIALELVAVVRLFANDFRLSIGTGDGRSSSRHTVKVFSKSVKASILTCLLTAVLLFVFGQIVPAKATLLCFPLFLAVEYALRLRRARRIRASQNQ